jgi:hypothetical protein
LRVNYRFHIFSRIILLFLLENLFNQSFFLWFFAIIIFLLGLPFEIKSNFLKLFIFYNWQFFEFHLKTWIGRNFFIKDYPLMKYNENFWENFAILALQSFHLKYMRTWLFFIWEWFMIPDQVWDLAHMNRQSKILYQWKLNEASSLICLWFCLMSL